jgi:hypothetical protein
MVCLVVGALPALAQSSLRPNLRPVPPQASSTVAGSGAGELHGSVVDDQGQPLPGAVVSALGATTVFAVSDRDGRYVFRNLSPGPYLVRAHLQGYLPGRGRVLQVAVSGRAASNLVLTRRADVGESPAILAAGIGPAEAVVPAAGDQHDHDEVAWRIRHGKRSVLKDAEAAVAELADSPSFLTRSRDGLARAMGNSARLASALFTELPLNGEINLMTTTSFNRPQDLFAMNVGAPRGLAYVSLAAPGPRGDWTMQGTLTQGDLSSWILAGSYIRHASAAHAYEAGLSYSMQRYMGGNSEALAALRDGSRNVGTLYAYDTWTMSPRLKVSYGAEYGHYDYLADSGLLSPRATVSFRPSPDDDLTVRGTVRHREIAPGAQEFLTPSAGLWLPPERTFSNVSKSAAFRPERFNHYEVSAERRWPGDVLIGVRAFRQQIDDQIVTLFDVTAVGDAPQVGHYQVGSVGDAAAHGWGVTVSRAIAEGMRASVDYTHAEAVWSHRSAEGRLVANLAPSIRRSNEPIHDLTASVESVVAPTSTRVFVVYKLNTAFAAADALATAPAPAARFNVQVNQALPFLNFTSAQWEMLVAVSNLFHRELMDGSIYDELLVVRPPKRVLGGVTVRF